MLFHLQNGQVSECILSGCRVKILQPSKQNSEPVLSECILSGCPRLLKSYNPRTCVKISLEICQIGRVTSEKWIVKALKPFISTIEPVTYPNKTYPGSIYHQWIAAVKHLLLASLYMHYIFIIFLIFLDIFHLKKMGLPANQALKIHHCQGTKKVEPKGRSLQRAKPFMIEPILKGKAPRRKTWAMKP